MKAMEYQIIQSSSADNLESIVNREILYGWKPLGGVTIIKDGTYIILQAMTRHEDDKDNA